MGFACVNIPLQPSEARHNTQVTELQEINLFSNAWQQVRINQSSSSVLTHPAERNGGNTKQNTYMLKIEIFKISVHF